MKSKNVNALLVEIMIAVLCFSLASIVILQTFVTAHNQSVLAEDMTEALLSAQNLADIVSAEDEDRLWDMLAVEQDEEGVYHFPDVGGISLTLKVTYEETEAGVLRRGTVNAIYQDQVLFSLPCAHYSEGVSQ